MIKEILFGVAVGDALGVPVEFCSRSDIRRNPVTDMIGYGTYDLPPGTWSDDSSLTFCLAEALTEGYNLHAVAHNFRGWLYENLWTPRGSVFDVGITTRHAIGELARGVEPRFAGDVDEGANGNGALMRILPLLLHIKDKPLEERYQTTRDVSSMTHGHIRSSLCCFYYLEFARHLVEGKNKNQAYALLQHELSDFFLQKQINNREVVVFDRLLKQNIAQLPESDIYSSGYVVHTLHASIWCLLTTNSFEEAVLKAVNLGEDTDTTGAVTGGLAALLYGYESIPQKWIEQLARKDDIEKLAERLEVRHKS